MTALRDRIAAYLADDIEWDRLDRLEPHADAILALVAEHMASDAAVEAAARNAGWCAGREAAAVLIDGRVAEIEATRNPNRTLAQFFRDEAAAIRAIPEPKEPT